MWTGPPSLTLRSASASGTQPIFCSRQLGRIAAREPAPALAANYITRLPKAEHEAQEWQAAMEALILVATSGGPTMFARIGVMRIR